MINKEGLSNITHQVKNSILNKAPTWGVFNLHIFQRKIIIIMQISLKAFTKERNGIQNCQMLL